MIRLFFILAHQGKNITAKDVRMIGATLNGCDQKGYHTPLRQKPL